MLQWNLDVAEKKLAQQRTAAQEGEKKISQLRKTSDEATSKLAEAQNHCRDLEAPAKGMMLGACLGCPFCLLSGRCLYALHFCLSAPLLEIQEDDAEARLREVAVVAKKMRSAVGIAVGMLFRGDPHAEI